LTWTRKRPIKDSVKAQQLTYSVKAFVRARRPYNSWVSWNGRLGGGPDFIVRSNGLQIQAPQGMLLESRDVCVPGQGSIMWLDKVGWAGTALNKKDCIHIAATDDRGRLEVAVTPVSDMQAAWQALLDAGFEPKRL
jgi:hypothetical protein